MKLQLDQLQSKSKEERQLEKMIKKTGREIHRLRKAKLGMNELDRHMFQEKMAFLTASKCQVPPVLFCSSADNDSLTSISSRSSTLKHAIPPMMSAGDEPEMSSTTAAVASSSTSSSTCSTPTPHLKEELHINSEKSSGENADRFSYEIDPDIGVIV